MKEVIRGLRLCRLHQAFQIKEGSCGGRTHAGLHKPLYGFFIRDSTNSSATDRPTPNLFMIASTDSESTLTGNS